MEIQFTQSFLFRWLVRQIDWINKISLNWSERKILLDVEMNFNNRSLTYFEDDTQCHVLPPNSMLLGRETMLEGIP